MYYSVFPEKKKTIAMLVLLVLNNLPFYRQITQKNITWRLLEDEFVQSLWILKVDIFKKIMWIVKIYIQWLIKLD